MTKPPDTGFMAHGHAPEPPIHEKTYPVSGEDVEELLRSPIEDEHKTRVLAQWRERLEARLHRPEDDTGEPPDIGDVLGRVVDAFTRVGARR